MKKKPAKKEKYTASPISLACFKMECKIKQISAVPSKLFQMKKRLCLSKSKSQILNIDDNEF